MTTKVKFNQLDDSPQDGLQYARQSGTWTQVTGSGGGAVSTSGWNSLGFSLLYSSSDSPVFVANVVGDVTSLISNGYRIKVTQNGSDKFFLVHGVGAFSSGTTPLTLYGGTDYVLHSTGTINSPQYSNAKAPFGFPLNPTKWKIITSSTSDTVQFSPTINVWYNVGSLSISAPVGLWKVDISGVFSIYGSAVDTVRGDCNLSTSNNSESDATTRIYGNSSGGGLSSNNYSVHVFNTFTINPATKTVYYLIARALLNDQTYVGFLGTYQNTIIAITSAYL
jgi:hypothetical protein